ncbi:MAG: endoribonuclease YicC domain-containing protein [Alistipes onderdonkii]
MAAQEEGAGRKLGFIAQEMGREINTMGSKANESNIQILVVKMKDELEKIKEQVLNILIMGKVIIFSAPSGSGKTTIVRELLKRFPQFEFSVSATSRAPCGCERHGCGLPLHDARRVHARRRGKPFRGVGRGLPEALATAFAALGGGDASGPKGNIIVFDVDVHRGINLKRIFGDDACSIFVMPPSIGELRRRLVCRGTDAPEVIDRRVAKAEFELTKAPEFDHIVVNDSLDEAIRETTAIIDQFIARQP